jgi:hypothetical protein
MTWRFSRRDLFGGVLSAIAAWLAPQRVEKRPSRTRAPSAPAQAECAGGTTRSYLYDENPQRVTTIIYDAQSRVVAQRVSTTAHRYGGRG